MHTHRLVGARQILASVLGGLILGIGTSGSGLAAIPLANGWYHVNLSKSAGVTVMLRSIRVKSPTLLTVTASYRYVEKNSLHTAFITATVNPRTNQVSRWTPTTAPTPKPPSAVFQWSPKDRWSALTTLGPTVIQLRSVRKTIRFPAKIPMYQTKLNPPSSKAPAAYDNAILGQDGSWLYMAMKGPGITVPKLTWHFRYWNRIVALNIHTGTYHIYKLPRMSSMNLVNTWNVPPAFTAGRSTVYIGLGNWIGLLPVHPAASLAETPIRHGLPIQALNARTNTVLAGLTRLQNQAATGLATYWNCQVMQKNPLGSCPPPEKFVLPWVMQPIIFNHGDQPELIDWAVDMPPTPDSKSAQALATRLRTLIRLEHSPINTAWIALNSAKAMQKAFHDTPPTALPGYHRKNGLYWLKDPHGPRSATQSR